MLDWNNIQPYVNPALIIIGFLVAGFIFEKILFSFIKKKTRTHKKAKIDFATGTLKFFMIVLFLIAGLYASIDILPMRPYLVNRLKQASLVIILFSVTFVVANISVGLIMMYSKRQDGSQSSTSIITNLIRTLIYVFGFTIILQSLGISITPILTALGIGGIAVALALQDTLTNFFAGLHIIASNQVKIGDYIRLDNGQEGYVTDIKWRDTTIRSLANNVIIVPNSKLSTNIITNFYKPVPEMGISVDMVTGFNQDLVKVEKICLEVAKEIANEIKGIAPGSVPSFGFGSFTENGVKFSVNFTVSEFTNQYAIKHEFIKRIVPALEKEGIPIPYPSREIFLKDKLPSDK